MTGVTRHHPHLTPRQREIVERIARGRTNIQIGDELGIGFETVKMHVSDILAELGVSSREEAAEWWRTSRRPLARLRALVPALSLAKLAAVGVSVGAVGAAGVVAVAMATAAGGPERNSPAAVPTATQTACEKLPGADCPPTLEAPRTPFAPTANILSVSPADGGTAGFASLVPSNPNVPNGVCAVVKTADLPQNFQQLRMTVDGADVTTQLVIVANPDTLAGKICYGPKGGLVLGRHSATLNVMNSNAASGSVVAQTATWSFTVVPDGPPVEPDAAYPLPSQCNSDLVAAVFNRFFAAWNRGDAQTMFDLVGDPRGAWFDLGYDPLTFVDAGVAKEIDLRTLADFRLLVAQYAGMHWQFYGEPTGALPAGGSNQPQSIDAALSWRLTGPDVTAAGKTAVFGSGKFGVYCDTQKLFGVLGQPTLQ